MNTRVPHSRTDSALTIPELIAVIITLAVVMALLFPAGSPPDAARRAQAATDAQSIVTAINSYVLEYGCFPGETDPWAPPEKLDRALGDPAAGLAHVPNRLIFDILRNINSPANPNNAYNQRQIIYLEARTASDPKNPKGGFLDDPSASADLKGCWFDPWGQQYCVVMDTDRDGHLDLTRFYDDFTGAAAPKLKAGAFSLGKDGQIGNKGDHHYRTGTDKSDDIVSWSN